MAVALTLSMGQDCRKELKDFGFSIAELLLLLGCHYCSLGPSYPMGCRSPWDRLVSALSLPCQGAGGIWAAAGFQLSLAVGMSCCESLMLLLGVRGAELLLWE